MLLSSFNDDLNSISFKLSFLILYNSIPDVRDKPAGNPEFLILDGKVWILVLVDPIQFQTICQLNITRLLDLDIVLDDLAGQH